MTLRTAVLMKTDIAGSTPTFRSLLASDLQALLHRHRDLVARLAAAHGGRVFRAEGDGYWLEFASVTDAARSAVAMQETLRLAQPNAGDDRLSMRVVIGLGDIAPLGSDLSGEALALITRIEDITPADEIYLTLAAHLVLVPAEIRTTLVESFAMQGFAAPVPVYRVELRHRTHVIKDAYILRSDLRGFMQLSGIASVATVERALDTFEALTNDVARAFAGRILFNAGDAYYLAFHQATDVVAAAERLCLNLKRESQMIHLVLSRGTINAFRSFLYGDGFVGSGQVQRASRSLLADGESGVFVSRTVRDALDGTPWCDRLRQVAGAGGLEIFRLDGV